MYNSFPLNIFEVFFVRFQCVAPIRIFYVVVLKEKGLHEYAFSGFSIKQRGTKEVGKSNHEVLVKIMQTRPVGAKRSLLVQSQSVHSVMKGMYNVLKSSMDAGALEQMKKLTVTPHASGRPCASVLPRLP